MGKIFLDVNVLIDVFLQRDKHSARALESHRLCTSALSFHIMAYVAKLKLPNAYLTTALSYLEVLPLDRAILRESMQGPTQDLEDNIQITSAVRAECMQFVTRDKRLLALRRIGSMQFVAPSHLANL